MNDYFARLVQPQLAAAAPAPGPAVGDPTPEDIEILDLEALAEVPPVRRASPTAIGLVPIAPPPSPASPTATDAVPAPVNRSAEPAARVPDPPPPAAPEPWATRVDPPRLVEPPGFAAAPVAPFGSGSPGPALEAPPAAPGAAAPIPAPAAPPTAAAPPPRELMRRALAWVRTPEAVAPPDGGDQAIPPAPAPAAPNLPGSAWVIADPGPRPRVPTARAAPETSEPTRPDPIEERISLSIGAIQIRVEPPAAPAHLEPPPPAAAPAAPRSTGLRRRCIHL